MIWIKREPYRITDYQTYDRYEKEIRANYWRVIENQIDRKLLILERFNGMILKGKFV